MALVRKGGLQVTYADTWEELLEALGYLVESGRYRRAYFGNAGESGQAQSRPNVA